MKVFAFDPTTGKRGEFLEVKRVISWTHESLDFAIEQGTIEPIAFVLPPSNPGTEWTAHVDAGDTSRDGTDHSYLTEQWICFCSGQWGEVWEWKVLPPKSAIIRK